jgi:hypothetical protein
VVMTDNEQESDYVTLGHVKLVYIM